MLIRAEIPFRAKTIVIFLSRDIYSDRTKNNITIKLSLCVTRALIFFTIKINFQDGRCTYKNTGSNHLTPPTLSYSSQATKTCNLFCNIAVTLGAESPSISPDKI